MPCLPHLPVFGDSAMLHDSASLQLISVTEKFSDLLHTFMETGNKRILLYFVFTLINVTSKSFEPQHYAEQTVGLSQRYLL